MRRPIGIDLFAGAGGLSLGFEQAGFDIVAAVEIDPVHAAAHKFNFPECAVIPRSVIGLSGRELRQCANLGRKEIDVVFGGAPCQGFSLIGQRALEDPRNSLVSEFVRLVGELKAKYFVFENVKGLTLGRQRQFLEELIEAFQVIGYRVQDPWLVLKASSYGVPQHRERLFIMGALEGYSLPLYPKPITVPFDAEKHDTLPFGPSCHEALGDIPDAEKYKMLRRSDAVKIRNWKTQSDYAAEMHCENGRGWHYGYERKWDKSYLTSSMRTSHTEISRSRFHATENGKIEPISRFFKLSADGVSNTLRAGTDSARGAFTSPRPIHYRYDRCVTVREMARLHGFPDWFRFHGTKWHGARQIGNSVPPPLARAIASELLRAQSLRPSRPKSIINLGDPRLLAMDMSQAAKFWGIENPIGRRNKKSGAKKRTQRETEAERKLAMRNQPYV